MKLRFVLSCLVLLPTVSVAQNQFHPRWEIPGFDFRPNGGWRVKAARVASTRRQLLTARNFSALNAPLARGGASAMSTAVSGTITVPAMLFGYSNTASEFMRDTSQYSQVLFGTSGGSPFTLRTYYDSLSNGQLTLAGRVMGWAVLAGPEVNYTGAQNCSGNPFGTSNCNGIFSTAAVVSMQNGFREALTSVDGGVNFGLFDNDGPDGNPNSGDDDGYVDMIMFAHPTRDGACGGAQNNHIWSHRFVLVNSTQTNFEDFITNDAASANTSNVTSIHISDYFATSALGGSTAPLSPCDSTQIMPIGTAAHEFGHALALPDLYDTGGSTEGIGQWGLMGSGNFTAPWSPSRMEAWSLNELGWVFLRSLTTDGTYHLGAAPVADTAFFIDVQGANPRTESFLVENRQGSQADSSVIRIHCSRHGLTVPPCSGGLLIWHLDELQIASHGFHSGNTVNVGPIHGLRLKQADGLGHLDDPNAPSNRRRGDAGDPYPGVSGNTAFAPRTNPAPKKNYDGSFPGFAIDSIQQVVPGGEMSFRLRFGNLTVVRGSDTAATVQVDGFTTNVFRDLFEDGSSHTVNTASPQTSPDQRRRFHFASWSDGGAQSHTIFGDHLGDTVVANYTRDFKLIATATAGGTITPDTAIDLAGTFITEGRAVTLTATADAGTSFTGWSGDTATSNAVLVLPMGRPYTVTASFMGALTTANVVAHLLGPTQPLTPTQIDYLDNNGNNNGTFDIGDFLAWVKATGAPLTAGLMHALQQKGARR